MAVRKKKPARMARKGKKKVARSSSRREERRKSPVTTVPKKVARKSGTGNGMTPFQPTQPQRDQVEIMTGFGMTQEEIACLIENPRTGKGISTRTLGLHFGEEMHQGHAKIKRKVVGSLIAKATGDHPQAVTAAIFVCKARYNWRTEDRVVVDVAAGTGVLVVPANISPADWIAQAQKENEGKVSPVDD